MPSTVANAMRQIGFVVMVVRSLGIHGCLPYGTTLHIKEASGPPRYELGEVLRRP